MTEAPWKVGQDEQEGKVSQGERRVDPQTKMPASLSISGVDTNPDVDEWGWQEPRATERGSGVFSFLFFTYKGARWRPISFFWKLPVTCNYPQPETVRSWVSPSSGIGEDSLEEEIQAGAALKMLLGGPGAALLFRLSVMSDFFATA